MLKKTRILTHINPNCLDARFCEPHGEIGEVYYSSKSLEQILKIAECNCQYAELLKVWKKRKGITHNRGCPKYKSNLIS